MFRLRSMRMASVALAFGVAAAAHSINIVITHGGGLSAQALTSLNAAANRWEAIYTDPVQINIRVFGQNLGGPGAFTQATQFNVPYVNTRASMVADAKTADDAVSVANLPLASLSFYTNRTTQNANVYFDNNGSANNTSSLVTRANAKALGLLASDAVLDADITFDNGALWDFDPTNGISGTLADFEGVGAHEMGHALGFVSGVDRVDETTFQSGNQSEDFQLLSPLDFHRFSTRGLAGTQRDFVMDNTTSRFFSINGGTTNLGGFSTGFRFGDGRQASHWIDMAPGSAIGIMDPVGNFGELMTITALDRRAFDVIGYDLVPEPASMAALGLGALSLLRRRRKA